MKLNKITKAIASVGLSVANLVTINAWAAQQTVNFSAGSGSGFQFLKDGENSVNDVTGFSLIFDAGTAPDYISINDWQYFTGTAAYSTSLTSVNGGGTSVGMILYEENGDAFSLESFTFYRQTSTDNGNYSITLKGYLDGDLKVTRNVVIPNASSNTSFTMTRASDFNDDLFKNIDKVTLDFPVINSGSDYDPRHAIINIVIDNAVATDSTAPILSQVTPVTTPTNDNTPNYTFSTDEAGTLSMGGNCGTSTSTTISGTGNQTIILTQTDNSSALADGTYSNCTVTVTDAAGNSSDALAITSFTVDTTAPAVAEVTAVTTPTNDTTPSYTFSTTETGAFTVGGSCGTSTSTTISSTGNQPITLTDTDNSSVLAAGTYSNCTITVTDDAGNSNTPLTITSFIIDTTNPTFDGASSTPHDNATDVSVSNNIVIDFSENIALGSNVITIRDVTGSSNFAVFNVATDSDGATTTPNAGRIGIVNDKIYLNPTSDLTGNRNYAIRIHEDAVNDNAGNSFTEIGDDTTFNFTTANTTPDVDLNSGTGGNDNSVSFSEGSGALNIAPSATVTEADGDTITTITVSLTNDQDGNVEGLNVTAAAQNALSGISGASDITLQDTITVTGATASAAEVQTFLQNISYNNTSSSPNETARTVTVVINDGTANSTSRTATVSVSNVTSANSTAAGFNTTNGTNLSPAITFTDDNETLVITNTNHATGSTADGGNGTDTLFAVDSVDLTGLTNLTNFETLTPDNDGALTLSESQHESFSTINGTGDNQFTIASANGDQSLTGDADIETYVLGTAMSFTLASGSQNVTGSTGNDTVNVAALTATGTLNGGTGTNTLQASSGANISGATLSAFSSLTLASGASVTMTEAQHDIFSTITAPGTETITISSSTDGLTGGSVVESYILSSANTFTLGTAGQNLTGSTGNDTVNVGALAATGTLAGGNGTDTLSVGNTGSIAGATLSGFENLSVASGGTASVAASQLSSFSGTISGSGTETLTISGDGNFSTVSAIENYTLSDDSTNARTVTISAAGHSVTGSVSSDAVTFDIGTLTYTGTITGENTVADTLSMGNGANITGATVSNVTNLTLASGATVNMTASQHSDFTGTITAPGSESINITGDGNITTLTGIESYNIGDDSTNTRTINISSSTTSVSATSGSDAITFSVGSNTYTGSLSGEPSVADVVSASDGADVTGGGFFNIGSLTLTSGATVAIDSANISNFSNAITGSGGTEVLKLMDGGTFNFANTTVSSVEGIALGTDSIFNITLTDNFNANGQSVTVTNTTGSDISADQTINASAFASDVLVISATDLGGSDTITGGSGADTIRPGAGTDTMTGNDGNDSFVGAVTDLNGDTIADLAIGDVVKLTGVTGLSTSNVRFNGTGTLEVDTNAIDFANVEVSVTLTNTPGGNLSFTVADNGSDTDITFVAPNDVPVFSSLNGGGTFVENGSVIGIDTDATVADTELDALNGATGNYNNATLTIARSGGANSEDVFSNRLLLGALTQGNVFTYNSVTVGTVTTNSAGTLVLTFNGSATSAIVDSVIQSIGYSNSSESPSSSITLNFTFNDGSANSTGTNQAVINITAQNDAPTDLSLSTTTVNQSSTGSGANIGGLSTTDVDTSDSHSYSLVSSGSSVTGTCTADTNNGSFQVNGSILQTQAALNAGSYIVCLQTNDSTTTFQKSFTITVTDDVAPNAPSTPDLDTASDSGASSTDNITNDTTPTLSGTAESGSTVTLYSDQVGGGATVIGTGTATGGNWQITASALTAGLVHAISAKATDSSSNVSSSSSALNITIDTTSPTAPSTPDLSSASDTGSSSTDNITNDTTPTFTGTGTNGDTVTIISSVDGSVGSAVVSGGVWSITPSSAMSSNTHTISARATDSAGNTTNSVSGLSMTIDTSVGTPSITTPIETDGRVNAAEDNDVLIVGTGAEANNSVTVQITDSNSTVSRTVTADGSGNWTISGQELDVSGLNNGSLTVSATQQDTAGNTSSAATQTITLDNIAPSALNITTPIETDGRVNAAEDNDVLIVGTGAEANNSVTVQITDSNSTVSRTVTADGSGNWTISGQELDVSGLNNGSLTVSATQQDTAGNTSNAATQTITLDNAVPAGATAAIDQTIINASNESALSFTLSGLEGSGSFTYQISDGTNSVSSSGAITITGVSQQVTSVNVSTLAEGTLTLTVTVTDSAGNQGTAFTDTVTKQYNVAPVLTGTPATSINEDSAYSFTPTLADSDTGDTHTYSITNKPTWASFDTQTGALTGTPDDSHVGTTSNIQISVNDGTDTGSLTAFNIEVVNTNDAPTGQNTNYTINEGATLSRDLNNGLLTLASDDDLDSNDSLTIVKDTDPQYGTLTLNTNGSFSYVHGGSENHTDSFTYHVEDSANTSSPVYTVTINMNAVEDAPTAVNDTLTTLEDASNTINVLANDSDPENNMVASSVVIKTQPTKGQVSVSNGVVTFTPTANENGADSFTYTVKDSTQAESNEATVSVTITAVNDLPIAANFTPNIDEDTSTSALSVRANATDVEDTTPTGVITLESQPTLGNASINQVVGTISYTPNANEAGTDNFTYSILDSDGGKSNIATISVNIGAVNDRPIAGNDSIVTNEDVAATLAILANDSDIEDQGFDGTDITLEDKGQGAGNYELATVTVGSDGVLAIVPKQNQSGTLSFTYTVEDSDGLRSDPATVTVTITAVNDAPVAVGNTAQILEDGNIEINVLGNDTDVDSQLNTSSVTITSAPQGGSAQVLASGAVLYTPSANFFGTDSFAYTVQDTEGLTSNAATVNITVSSVNDAPVISGTPPTSVNEDESYSFTPSASDNDQDTLTFSITGLPVWASFDDSTGALLGTPIEGQDGNYDNIVISVSDGQESVSLAAFSITVNAVNDAPTISGTPATTVLQDESYSFTPQASDVDSNELTFEITNLPSWASFDNATGSLSGTPTGDNVGDYGNIVISVGDGALQASLPAFNITVEPVNAAPVASNMQRSVNEDGTTSFVADATDADGDALTIELQSQPQNGQAVVQGTTISYTPLPNFNGNDEFSFVASDGQLQSDVALVNISVVPVNDAPIAIDDTFTFDAVSSNQYSLPVLDNDLDPDGGVLRLLGARVSLGSVSVSDNTLIYQGVANAQGPFAVTYVIEDTDKARAVANATITINNTAGGAGAPTIQAPSGVTVNATGLFTKVDLGTAIATDSQGNPLPVSLTRNVPIFAPGQHVAYWQTQDSQGLQATASQSVNVNPLVSLQKNSQVAEDKSHSVGVYLNGVAPSYPVTIPYTVSGSADSSDHDLQSGEVVISSGTQANINFNIFADTLTEGNETIVINLDSSLNLGAKSSSTVTIVEQNVAPVITTSVSQEGEERSLVTASDSNVTITASVSDPNPNDQVTVTWQSDSALTNTSSDPLQFVFNPQGIATGIYKVAAKAEDSATPSLATNKDVYIEIIAALDPLAGNDSDGDLIPDDEEGYADSDGDGIPDYLDAISDCNVMQEQALESSQFLVEGDPGVCLRKGVTVAQNQTGGVQLLEAELPNDPSAQNIGGLFDYIATGLPKPGEVYSIVLPQRSPIPGGAVYRKLSNGQWQDFVIGDGNQVLSAVGEPGFCPPPGEDLWIDGLAEGSWCVQLRIVDGGPNDDDGIANSTIVDPGGIAVLLSDNSLPIANADSVTIVAGQTIIIDVIENDTDADGDALTVSGATVDFGNVVVENNQLHYTPPAMFIGEAMIQYSVTDGQGGTANSTATVSIVTNQAPNVVNDSVTSDGSALVIDVLANDSDPEGTALSLVSASATHGSVVVNIDNTLSYTPQSGFTGSDTITYVVRDEFGATAEGIVSVTVSIQQNTSTTISNSSSGSMGGILVLIVSALFIRRRKALLPAFAVVSSMCAMSASASPADWKVTSSVGQATADTEVGQSPLIVSNVDDSDISWSIGAFYQVAPNWDVGLRYINLGEGRIDFSGSVLEPNDAHNVVRKVAPVLPEGVSIQVDYSKNLTGKFQGKVFFGAFNWKYKIDSASDSGTSYRFEDNGTSGYLGGGVYYEVSNDLTLGLDYSHYFVSKNDISEIALGLQYRF
ncbi:hypothetical protein PSECIP111951_03909 [Pseudoalteromonas holothuriae]|uniref:Dystroglycan-type cadherin-like domain-containing protein n=1 Tax=Pseudoalteromonas holothuriae TaxID=2963714 RepID=A0ABN8URE7_9GAMM|nr:Ig-like domain-containing protein [Pseudoalteromonas sp. CIP111951]CAH9067825.1 hypothetical protein PSECIP111951_03909 [Pseudoalteromonas sp. CIP111951]